MYGMSVAREGQEKGILKPRGTQNRITEKKNAEMLRNSK